MQKDPNARTLKKRSFPFYYDWIEIFGKDRANGENSQSFSDAVNNVLNNDSLNPQPTVGDEQPPETPPFNETSHANFQSNCRGESSSATNKSKGKKRKSSVDYSDDRFIDTMTVFCDKTDARIGEMTFQMSQVAERIGVNFDAAKKRATLYDTLGRFDLLSSRLNLIS